MHALSILNLSVYIYIYIKVHSIFIEQRQTVSSLVLENQKQRFQHKKLFEKYIVLWLNKKISRWTSVYFWDQFEHSALNTNCVLVPVLCLDSEVLPRTLKHITVILKWDQFKSCFYIFMDTPDNILKGLVVSLPKLNLWFSFFTQFPCFVLVSTIKVCWYGVTRISIVKNRYVFLNGRNNIWNSINDYRSIEDGDTKMLLFFLWYSMWP